eukprot:1373467-Prymnesium_polylepis.1
MCKAFQGWFSSDANYSAASDAKDQDGAGQSVEAGVILSAIAWDNGTDQQVHAKPQCAKGLELNESLQAVGWTFCHARDGTMSKEYQNDIKLSEQLILILVCEHSSSVEAAPLNWSQELIRDDRLAWGRGLSMDVRMPFPGGGGGLVTEPQKKEFHEHLNHCQADNLQGSGLVAPSELPHRLLCEGDGHAGRVVLGQGFCLGSQDCECVGMELPDTIGAVVGGVEAVISGKEILALGAGPVHQAFGSQGAPTKLTGKLWTHDLMAATAVDASVLVLILMGIVCVVLAKWWQRIGQHHHLLIVASERRKRTQSESEKKITGLDAFPHSCLLLFLLLIPTTMGSVHVSAGSRPNEVSWIMVCSGGSVLEGGAPFLGSFKATTGENCALHMRDGAGDGWNGARWIGFGQNVTLESGRSRTTQFVVPSGLFAEAESEMGSSLSGCIDTGNYQTLQALLHDYLTIKTCEAAAEQGVCSRVVTLCPASCGACGKDRDGTISDDEDMARRRLQDRCENTCVYPTDGICDDGGDGSQYAACDLGTDCDD